MSTEAERLFGETVIRVPSDGRHIMIDCHPKLFEAADIAIEFDGPDIRVQRTDSEPVQIRRLVQHDKFGPGLLGLHEPVSSLELTYSDEWKMWFPADHANVADERGARKFAYLIHTYGARKLLAAELA